MNDIAAHITVPHDHPSLAGHFPGRPTVPGVVLLDAVLDTIRARAGRAVTLESIVSTKFLQAVEPDRRIELQIKFAPDAADRWKARFVATYAAATVLEGSFLIGKERAPEATEAAR